MNRIEQAQQFAHEAHDSIKQVRKYTGEPYWVHTDSVAGIVASVGGSEDMIIAAHLHDVLEDVTPLDKTGVYQAATIGVRFGEHVLKMVWELTDEFTKESRPGWNRAKRKEMERQRVGKISKESKTIKLADLIDNTASIVEHDKDFAVVYLREKLDLLPYLSDGNAELLNRAALQVVAAAPIVGIDIPRLSS